MRPAREIQISGGSITFDDLNDEQQCSVWNTLQDDGFDEDEILYGWYMRTGKHTIVLVRAGILH